MSTPFDAITIGQVVAGGGPIVATVGLIVAAGRYFRRWSRLMDAMQGTPAMPGVPAQPGVLERLERNETALGTNLEETRAVRLDVAALSTQVGGLSQQMETVVPAVAQLQPNHGSSLKDAIGRIELNTARAAYAAHVPTSPVPGGTP